MRNLPTQEQWALEVMRSQATTSRSGSRKKTRRRNPRKWGKILWRGIVTLYPCSVSRNRPPPNHSMSPNLSSKQRGSSIEYISEAVNRPPAPMSAHQSLVVCSPSGPCSLIHKQANDGRIPLAATIFAFTQSEQLTEFGFCQNGWGRSGNNGGRMPAIGETASSSSATAHRKNCLMPSKRLWAVAGFQRFSRSAMKLSTWAQVISAACCGRWCAAR